MNGASLCFDVTNETAGEDEAVKILNLKSINDTFDFGNYVPMPDHLVDLSKVDEEHQDDRDAMTSRLGAYDSKEWIKENHGGGHDPQETRYIIQSSMFMLATDCTGFPDLIYQEISKNLGDKVLRTEASGTRREYVNGVMTRESTK